LADRQAALYETPRANWFMLDSLERTELTPGTLGHEQLDWLADTLDEHTDKPAILLFHHNPGLLGEIGGLRDSEALFKVIRPRKQVKACFYGHTHDWHLRMESGIHLINLPPTAYVFADGKPSGWVRAMLSDDKIQITLITTDPKHPANGEVRTLYWRS
jgi:3',5'-cyclic AMP phosphodiesterase CpdA